MDATQTTAHKTPGHEIAAGILASECPWTLDIRGGLSLQDAKSAIASSIATDPADADDRWRAYDLVHTLAVNGRAF